MKGEQLARTQSIPLKFLENILVELRHAGLVQSQRGVEGGYWLARPAAEITLAEVIRAVEGPLANVRGDAAGVARIPRHRRAVAERLDRRAGQPARRARVGHARRRRERRAAVVTGRPRRRPGGLAAPAEPAPLRVAPTDEDDLALLELQLRRLVAGQLGRQRVPLVARSGRRAPRSRGGRPGRSWPRTSRGARSASSRSCGRTSRRRVG